MDRLLLFAAAVGIAAVGAVFSGCDDGPDEVAPWSCDRQPALTYDNFGAGFLDTHCNGCHSSLSPTFHRNGAPDSVNLDTWALAQQFAPRIAARTAVEVATMPPGGGPTAEERHQLAEWLYCSGLVDEVALTEHGEELVDGRYGRHRDEEAP